jgi:hypothetical protein
MARRKPSVKNRRASNPRNQESQLFKRLTRFFSGPVVNYRTQNIRKYRRRHLDRFKFKSASGKAFKKTDHNPYAAMEADLMANQNRAHRYTDFDQMEYTPEIASSLDIYADEMTTSSDIKPMMSIMCPNEEIKVVLYNLYNNILNLSHNLFGWSRTMCKYGDFFVYLDIDEDVGIKAAIGLPTNEVERLEGEDESNPHYVQYQWNSGGLTFENWQIAHFRILGNDKYAPYGTSILEPARRIWRQLTMLEDAVMAYRIVRSPERRVFYIDVGNIPPEEVEQYMQKVMTQMKRNQVIDPDTGRVDLRYNPMSVEEDYFIPVRGGTSSKVESLAGGSYTGDIDDIKYLRDKLFSALKIPASYLSSGEEAEDKTTLAQKDVRFARTIQRLQRVLVTELEKIGIIHLYTLGFRGDDLLSFGIKLNNPSKIAEMQELEHWKAKFDAAASATEGYFSRRWIAEHIFDMSDEEFLRNQREMFYDKKFEAMLEIEAEAVMQAGSVEAEADAMDVAADEGLLPDEPPPEEALPEEGAPPEEAPPEGAPGLPAEDETALLAEPAKRNDDATGHFVRTRNGTSAYVPANRDDGAYLTPGSKGKHYIPSRDDGRETAGLRKQMLGLTNWELSKNTLRNTHKGYTDGIGRLSRGMIPEERSNYNEKKEENQLFEVNQESKRLIEMLERKNNNEET